MPFERVVDSPQGVGDIYDEYKLLCAANYNLQVFQDFVPRNGSHTPFDASSMPKRVEGDVRVPEYIRLEPASLYTLHVADGRRLMFHPAVSDDKRVYRIQEVGQRITGLWTKPAGSDE
jgi:hypothetical protein